MTTTTEEKMVAAHRLGRAHAREAYAMLGKTAMDSYPGDHEAQFAYMAGFIRELARRGRMVSHLTNEE